MTSEVFYYPCGKETEREKILRGLKELILRTGFLDRISEHDFVAVKTHFGEKGNRGYIKPDLGKVVVDLVRKKGSRVFFTDTNALYTGQRSNAVDHLRQAYRHGFTPEECGAPVIISDGVFGDSEVIVEIPGRHYPSVSLARDIALADALVSLNHMTGHLATGFGCALKNLGMGCATRKGKMAQHSVMKPAVIPGKCTSCGLCVEMCPEDAISLETGGVVIDSDACVGCGQCLVTCRYGAFQFDWNEQADRLQEKMVEFAMGVLKTKGDKAVHVTVLMHVTGDCDCMARTEETIVEDIGILASRDVVAIEQAALDLVSERGGGSVAALSGREGLPVVQVNYAEELGLGSSEYRLVTVGS